LAGDAMTDETWEILLLVGALCFLFYVVGKGPL
jgi:hypothetical protein